MTDAVERFRAELAKLGGDDEDAEGRRLLHSLFESTVAPYVNELELGQEAWGVVEAAMEPPAGEPSVDTARRAAELIRVVVREQGSEDPVAALREGLLEARGVVRVVVEALGFPADVELSAVVARVRRLAGAGSTETPDVDGADGGLDLGVADRSLLRAVGEGWVREVGQCGALRWQRPGRGAEPFESAEWARFERLRDAGLVSTVDAVHPYLTEQGCHELGRLWKVAALPGIEVAEDAVRGNPEAVLSVVRAALAELHEVRQVREGPALAPAPDVVGVARVRELLRAADDLRELPAVGGWWARGARERERMLVAAWLVRRARMIVDAPVGGGLDGG